VLDAFAPPDMCEHVVFFPPPVLRNDEGDMLPNCLAGRVPVHSFRAGIPRRDDAGERLAHNRVVGRVDDGRQASGDFIRPPCRIIDSVRFTWRAEPLGPEPTRPVEATHLATHQTDIMSLASAILPGLD
jgi:hypothetical protein